MSISPEPCDEYLEEFWPDDDDIFPIGTIVIIKNIPKWNVKYGLYGKVTAISDDYPPLYTVNIPNSSTIQFQNVRKDQLTLVED